MTDCTKHRRQHGFDLLWHKWLRCVSSIKIFLFDIRLFVALENQIKLRGVSTVPTVIDFKMLIQSRYGITLYFPILLYVVMDRQSLLLRCCLDTMQSALLASSTTYNELIIMYNVVLVQGVRQTLLLLTQRFTHLFIFYFSILL